MAKKAKAASGPGGRAAWFDEASSKPLIDQYARQLESFLQTFADGKVEASELDAQEKRVVKLMKAIEPKLDDELHGKVTELLCEMTAYDIMQMVHAMQSER